MADEVIDYRVLPRMYGRPNTTEGTYSIPSHVWIDVGGMCIRHEMGHIAHVELSVGTITILTAGEWQMKLKLNPGEVWLKEFNANRS